MIFSYKTKNIYEGVIIMMFFGGWMIIVWVVIIALIVWGVIALVKRNSFSSDARQKHDPLDIAKERYAKGEISKEEFDEIKKNLT
jgi:putative membrane protein